MTNDEKVLHRARHACQCASCRLDPGKTYTPEFMQECMARWFVNASAAQRNEYLSVLRKQPGGDTRLQSLRAVAQRLGLSVDCFPT